MLHAATTKCYIYFAFFSNFFLVCAQTDLQEEVASFAMRRHVFTYIYFSLYFPLLLLLL